MLDSQPVRRSRWSEVMCTSGLLGAFVAAGAALVTSCGTSEGTPSSPNNPAPTTGVSATAKASTGASMAAVSQMLSSSVKASAGVPSTPPAQSAAPSTPGSVMPPASASVAPVTSGSAVGMGSAMPSAAPSSAPATLKMPIERGDKYAFEFGDVLFEVEKAGGRVATFALGGKNVLVSKATAGNNNYGSTLDLSPQDPKDPALGTCWPPPAGLDTGAYTVDTAALAMNKIVLTSPVSKPGYKTCPTDDKTDAGMSSIVVKKTFTPLLDKGAVQMDFELQNKGTAAISWAPWQITRVASGGLTFFPTATSTKPIRDELPLTRDAASGWSFWLYKEADITKEYGSKMIIDGSEGWLGHASSDGLTFISRFADTTSDKFAPGDGEIAVYGSPPKNTPKYVEIEPQGAYVSIAAGASSTWTVTWYLYKTPASAKLMPGDAALVDFVKTLKP